MAVYLSVWVCACVHVCLNQSHWRLFKPIPFSSTGLWQQSGEDMAWGSTLFSQGQSKPRYCVGVWLYEIVYLQDEALFTPWWKLCDADSQILDGLADHLCPLGSVLLFYKAELYSSCHQPAWWQVLMAISVAFYINIFFYEFWRVLSAAWTPQACLRSQWLRGYQWVGLVLQGRLPIWLPTSAATMPAGCRVRWVCSDLVGKYCCLFRLQPT